MQAKLGLTSAVDRELIDDLYSLLADQAVDGTVFFRSLSDAARGSADGTRALFADAAAFDAWAARWRAAIAADERPAAEVAAAMDRVNPVYIPRNHLVEAALDAAAAGDLDPFTELLDVVSQPFTERPGLQRYAEPASLDAPPHRTFCGT